MSLTGSEIPGLYIRGSEDLSQLTEEEVAQFGFWVLGYFRYVQYAYDQRREGNLSDSTWETIELMFKTQFPSPGVRTVWNVRGSTFKRSFRDYVDSIEIGEDVQSPSAAFKEMVSGQS